MLHETAFPLEMTAGSAFALYDATTTKLRQANGAYLSLLERARGRPGSTNLGRPWIEAPLFFSSNEAHALFERVVDTHESVEMLWPTDLPGQDEELILHVTAAPILSDDGESVEAVAVSVEDATARFEAIRGLEEGIRMRDQFMALVCHELRTPLAPLIGHSEMLADVLQDLPANAPPELAQRAAGHLKKILKQVDRLDKLIDDLIDLSRLQTGKFSLELSKVDLGEVVEQSVEEARMLSPQHAIHVQRPLQSPVIHGDRGRLIQVLVNLLDNAIRHGVESNRIEIHLISPDAHDPGTARVRVRDFGPGIPPEHQAHIFSKLYQVSHKDQPTRRGLGLGLYIAKEIVEQSGGSITVESTPGKGTTFEVRLPIAPIEPLE